MKDLKDTELIKDLGGLPKKEEKPTRDELIQEFEEINNRLRHLRVMQKEANDELRKVMKHSNGIEENIERAEDELEKNNYKLQFKQHN